MLSTEAKFPSSVSGEKCDVGNVGRTACSGVRGISRSGPPSSASSMGSVRGFQADEAVPMLNGSAARPGEILRPIVPLLGLRGSPGGVSLDRWIALFLVLVLPLSLYSGGVGGGADRDGKRPDHSGSWFPINRWSNSVIVLIANPIPSFCKAETSKIGNQRDRRLGQARRAVFRGPRDRLYYRAGERGKAGHCEQEYREFLDP